MGFFCIKNKLNNLFFNLWFALYFYKVFVYLCLMEIQMDLFEKTLKHLQKPTYIENTGLRKNSSTKVKKLYLVASVLGLS